MKRDDILSGIKAYMSQIILQHGTITVKQQQGRLQSKKTRVKRICSEVSINSPGNPWSQSGKRKNGLRWDGFAENEGFKSGVEV